MSADVADMPLAKALNAGLRKALADDPKVLLMGEDIGPLGGVFRVTEHLQSEFGKRVIDTPLAESGIIGTAIGLAMRGYRPVCEIQFDGFIFPGFDQITTQLAKMTNRHEGQVRMPVVIRVPYGGHIGAVEHHQESPEAYFAHTPGLRLVSPSTPHDAYWMIQEAIASNDPVMFFERSEEHTSELQSRPHLVCRLLLEKKKRGSAHRGRRRLARPSTCPRTRASTTGRRRTRTDCACSLRA